MSTQIVSYAMALSLLAGQQIDLAKHIADTATLAATKADDAVRVAAKFDLAR